MGKELKTISHKCTWYCFFQVHLSSIFHFDFISYCFSSHLGYLLSYSPSSTFAACFLLTIKSYLLSVSICASVKYDHLQITSWKCLSVHSEAHPELLFLSCFLASLPFLTKYCELDGTRTCHLVRLFEKLKFHSLQHFNSKFIFFL
jgi:hypothetical protein